MNAHRDQLDEAIDAMAARMTAVEEDRDFAGRIVNALPQRSPWSLRWLMPRLAVGVLATIAIAFVLRTFSDRSTDVLRTENAATLAPPSIAEPASTDRRTDVERPLIVRRTYVEPLLIDRRSVAESDHAFALAGIEAPHALSIEDLTPSELGADAPLSVEPLEISALPATSDFPR